MDENLIVKLMDDKKKYSKNSLHWRKTNSKTNWIEIRLVAKLIKLKDTNMPGVVTAVVGRRIAVFLI